MTRILMIEDNRSAASIVEGYLFQQIKGLVFHHTPTLALANQVLRRKSFDVILLDVDLPDGNGLAWLESDMRMKNLQYPVIVLSSSESIRTVFAAINAGADHYLDKSMASVEALPGLIADMTPSAPVQMRQAA